MAVVTAEQVGTVEILVARVYPLDPGTADHPLVTEVCVAPGTYPLYQHYDAYFWMMTGHLNSRGPTKIGDGMFYGGGPDGPFVGPEITFPSRRYGSEQWAEFTADPVCTEGHPAQRLRIVFSAKATR